MLGLGLGSHKASALRSLAAKLLAKLRGRSTYYENNQASKDTIHEIDNYELLDKATILLTPTATSDARVHSVKTYTGDDFLTSTWTSPTGGWSVTADGVSNSGTNGNVRQNIEMTDYLGRRFRLTYTLSNVTDSTTLSVKFGGGSTVPVEGTNGTYTVYLINDATVDNFQFLTGGDWAGDITNISLVDVSSDFDFDRASSATRINSSGLVQDMQSITDPELVTDGDFALTGTQAASTTGTYWTTADSWTISNNKASYDGTTNGSILEQAIDLDNGNTYEVTLTISDNSGRFRLSIDSGTADYNTYTTGNGTYKFYFVASADEVQIRGSLSDSATTFSLSDISVKDVTFSTDVDLARINYDSNGENGHILLEPTSTNLVPYSEDFSQSAWGETRCTILANQAISPDGTLNADLMTATDDDARLQDVVGNAGVIVTQSIYVKSATGGNVSGQIDFAGANVVTFTANNEWQRVETTLSDTSISPRLRVRITNDGDSLYVWGAQVEALPYATSYIPNHGTAAGVTRAAETLTGSGNSTLINSTEGVLYAEIAMLSENDKDSDNQLFLNDGTSLQRVGIFTESAGDIRVQIRDNDEAIDIRNLTALDQSESGIDTAAFNKIAIQYKSGENKLFVNGSRITDTNFDSMVFNFSSLDNLDFGSGANSNYFRGKCKALAVFNEALSDDELELLTGVTNYGSFGELASANGYTII